MISSPS